MQSTSDSTRPPRQGARGTARSPAEIRDDSRIVSNRKTPTPPRGLPIHDPSLAQDAEAFSNALEALARVYQLQDPRRTCSYGITLTECYALEAVALGGPLTINEVAASLVLDKSTASRAVAGLVRKGLAARREHRADGRAVEVRASPSGLRLYERIRSAGRRLHRELLRELPPETRRAAATLLHRVASAERACASAGCDPAQ